MGYQRQAIIGISWVGLFRAMLRGTAFIRTAFLARLLNPVQFGTFGIAAILLGLFEMFTETGINVFLIQQPDQSALKKYLNTAWVTSILRGALISLLIIILTPFVARFFNNPASIPLLLLIALVPLIRGFINPSVINFQKQLQFKQEFWFRTSIALVDAGFAITTAYLYRTPASLAIGLIAGVALEVILSWVLIKPRPRFKFNLTQFKTITHHGKWITASGIFAYFTAKGPDIAIGRLLSTASLGFYQMAFKYSVVPVNEIMETNNKVGFPVYTKIAGDRARLKKAFLKNYLAVLSVAVPFLAVIYIFAQPLVNILLGSDWLSIVPYMRALTVAGFLISLGSPTNPLYLAVHKQSYLTYCTFIKFTVLTLTIIPLTLNYGILGSIYAFTLAGAVVLIPRAYFTHRILTTDAL